MAKEFDIPRSYRSEFITGIKKKRSEADSRKSDLLPTVIDAGSVIIKIARFFGFCYGVENAIEIAYRAIEENPDKRVFLLSEMIHNPHVNGELHNRGVQFLQTAEGKELIPLSELSSDDVVIVPAFGTTLELFAALEARGINPQQYNATCPFVEKVWRRGKQLAEKGYTIVIHGKHTHEETRATFSHIRTDGPSVVVRDRVETLLLVRYIKGELPEEGFYRDFAGRYSDGFNPSEHLSRIGVVNQTTMLAEETHEIALLVKEALLERFGLSENGAHFADTRDTLCYATSENQSAMRSLIAAGGDIALVVGGYNSSNTSHLVELCEGHVPAFFIRDAHEILDAESIRHLDLYRKEVITTHGWLPSKRPLEVLVSAGASCPDSMVEAVIRKVVGVVPGANGSVVCALGVSCDSTP